MEMVSSLQKHIVTWVWSCVDLPMSLKWASETHLVAMLGSEVQKGWCLIGPDLRGWDGFQWQHGVREGLGMGYIVLKMHDKIETYA